MSKVTKARLNRATQWIVSSLFIVLTALPLLAMALRPDTGKALSEKRSLAPLPHLEPQLDSLRAFPAAFEAYFNDHFGFRQVLVRAFNYAMVVWFRTAPDRGNWRNTGESGVLLGEAGWLFYSGDRVVDYHRSIKPFTDEDMEAWQRDLELRRDWLAERGIPFLFMIAPNKHTIYPQHVPKRLTRVHATSRLDQLVEWMEQRSDLRILDVRPELWRATQQRRVYNQTGTHWNDHGAYIAYEQILKALAPSFPDLAPHPLADFTEKEHRYAGGLSRLLDLRDVLTENIIRLRRRAPLAQRSEETVLPSAKPRSAQHIPYAMVRDDNVGPRAVVFHDSFMNAIKPFLSEHFSRVVYYWQLNFDLSVIEHEKPDLVIHEVVERKLMRRRLPSSDRLKSLLEGPDPPRAKDQAEAP